MSIEAMKQALEALDSKHDMSKAEWRLLQYKAFHALRAAIEQAEKAEPVAWVAYENGEKHGIDFEEDEIAKLPVGTMLYAAPPQREWQGLTDEEMMMIYGQSHEGKKYSLGRAIEAKLKEKNAP